EGTGRPAKHKERSKQVAKKPLKSVSTGTEYQNFSSETIGQSPRAAESTPLVSNLTEEAQVDEPKNQKPREFASPEIINAHTNQGCCQQTPHSRHSEE